MSTFDGYVKEFPDIRIDYFRTLKDRKPPLKCFLSHVHSDHLQGLESLKSPFVYCSAATRAILLRLEKYPHRMNVAKGILECRKQHYKHLKNILKPLPLNTPSEIELGPGNTIQVTLFDANHCSGDVMFLIQGGGKAILYTGDIRSEPWWVDSLTRNPILIPYTHGRRRLDQIYLDTTFAPDRHVVPSFPTKAEGLSELLSQVARYPKETIFHLHAWTYGYEEVWIALANALNSRIHVDDYKRRVYQSLRLSVDNGSPNDANGKASDRIRESHDIYLTAEAAALCGHRSGNNNVLGYLTSNPNVRLHSCKRGTSCKALDSPDVVWITPILTHAADGHDVLEIGAGGGGGDLNQHELQFEDEESMMALLQLCSRAINDRSLTEETKKMITAAFLSPTQKISLDSISSAFSDSEILLEDFARLLTDATRIGSGDKREDQGQSIGKQKLSRQIRFPYSRHSSYDELCHLISVFKPRDVHPCTVDKHSWSKDVSVRSMFGHLCSDDVFTHDAEMEALEPERERRRAFKRSRRAQSSENDPMTSSQVGQSSKTERDVRATEPDISSSPPWIPSIDTTPRVKRRKTDEGHSKAAVTRSPKTITTCSTNTMSYERRLEGIRHSFEGHLKNSRENPRSFQHSNSDPTPLHLHTPDSGSSSSTVRRDIKPQNHELSLRSPLQSARPEQRSSAISRSKEASNHSPKDTLREIPEGTQARPINLSDMSDPDTDADATTDGEGEKPFTTISNVGGANEGEQKQNTQVTLSDSAFESQGHSQPKADKGLKEPRLRGRKEAYQAAKQLAASGWEDGFAIVSSNAGSNVEETEL